MPDWVEELSPTDVIGGGLQCVVCWNTYSFQEYLGAGLGTVGLIMGPIS